jgi:hypothetical protein
MFGLLGYTRGSETNLEILISLTKPIKTFKFKISFLFFFSLHIWLLEFRELG